MKLDLYHWGWRGKRTFWVVLTVFLPCQFYCLLVEEEEVYELVEKKGSVEASLPGQFCSDHKNPALAVSYLNQIILFWVEEEEALTFQCWVLHFYVVLQPLVVLERVVVDRLVLHLNINKVDNEIKISCKQFYKKLSFYNIPYCNGLEC